MQIPTRRGSGNAKQVRGSSVEFVKEKVSYLREGTDKME